MKNNTSYIFGFITSMNHLWMHLTRSSKNLIWFFTPPFTFSSVTCKFPLFCLYHVSTSNFCTCFSNVWVGGHWLQLWKLINCWQENFCQSWVCFQMELGAKFLFCCCNNMTNLSRVAIGNYTIPNKSNRITHGQEFHSGMLLVVRIGGRGNIVVGWFLTRCLHCIKQKKVADMIITSTVWCNIHKAFCF